MSTPDRIASRLRLPIIAAPMFRVSGPDLALWASGSGIDDMPGLTDLVDWLTSEGAGACGFADAASQRFWIGTLGHAGEARQWPESATIGHRSPAQRMPEPSPKAPLFGD